MELYKPTTEELEEVLDLHKMWLDKKEGGKRAIMDNWALDYASFQGVRLDYAALRHASLVGASLRNASLRNARLECARLEDASLDGAILEGAFLEGAILEGASLDGVKGLSFPIACPSHGAFTAWKKACYCPDKLATPERREQVIVELLIPADAKRSSAASRKCRCDKAQVVSITDAEGKSYDTAFSQRDCRFVYKVGKTVSVPDYNEDRWNECGAGIHFFIDKQEAIEW